MKTHFWYKMGTPKSLPNLPLSLATGMEVDSGEVPGAKEDAIPSQPKSNRERFQKEIDVAMAEVDRQRKEMEDKFEAEIRAAVEAGENEEEAFLKRRKDLQAAANEALVESFVDLFAVQEIAMKEVKAHREVTARSYEREKSLKRKMDSVQLQLQEQKEVAESLKLKVAKLEQDKEEMKATESLRFQVAKLEQVVEHMKVAESLRLQVAKMEQDKVQQVAKMEQEKVEQMRLAESLRLHVARMEQEKAEQMKAGASLSLRVATQEQEKEDTNKLGKDQDNPFHRNYPFLVSFPFLKLDKLLEETLQIICHPFDYLEYRERSITTQPD